MFPFALHLRLPNVAASSPIAIAEVKQSRQLELIKVTIDASPSSSRGHREGVVDAASSDVSWISRVLASFRAETSSSQGLYLASIHTALHVLYTFFNTLMFTLN
jgi:hypothetical protein